MFRMPVDRSRIWRAPLHADQLLHLICRLGTGKRGPQRNRKLQGWAATPQEIRDPTYRFADGTWTPVQGTEGCFLHGCTNR